MSFHLGAVLISLGFITYVEHGKQSFVGGFLFSTLEPFHLEKVLRFALMANCTHCETLFLFTAVLVIFLLCWKKLIYLFCFNALVLFRVLVLRKRLAAIFNACILSKKCLPNCTHQNKKVKCSSLVYLFFFFKQKTFQLSTVQLLLFLLKRIE